jgi:hypothetical protein
MGQQEGHDMKFTIATVGLLVGLMMSTTAFAQVSPMDAVVGKMCVADMGTGVTGAGGDILRMFMQP